MKKRRELPNVAFLDLLWNALLGFVVLFSLAFVQMNIRAAEQRLETRGEFAIVVAWHDKSEDDVDTYVMDPQGNIIFFRSRERGLMHLERDDFGAHNDYVIENGQKVKVTKNEERVIIRGIISGEYVVNVHMYRKTDQTSTKVKVVLVRLKNRGAPITEKEAVLEKNGDEVTAFRFTLDKNGNVSNINDLQRSMVGKAHGGQP